MWWPRERNRKRGGGGEDRENKYLTLLMGKTTNSRDRHREGQQWFPQVIPLSSSTSSLNQKIFMEKPAAHLTQKSG